ncbi:hypothetical protein TNCV_3647631 [Trichonephila clavipes]|nr:hypothetical protein TNCV_3647631 [Trichonephila clavipes]
MARAECMVGPLDPTPQRCNSGCSEYRQCVLDRCGSERNPILPPNYDTGHRTTVAVYNASIQQQPTTVSLN